MMNRVEQPAQQAAEPATSPTTGMNMAQRILHVGGRNNAAGYVEFGSIQAVEALVRQVLRDLPTQQPLTSWQRRQIIMSVKTVGEAIDMVEAIHNIKRPTIPTPQLEAAQALIDHQAAQVLGKEGGAA